jgi:hypothetical protein
LKEVSKSEGIGRATLSMELYALQSAFIAHEGF